MFCFFFGAVVPSHVARIIVDILQKYSRNRRFLGVDVSSRKSFGLDVTLALGPHVPFPNSSLNTNVGYVGYANVMLDPLESLQVVSKIKAEKISSIYICYTTSPL